MRAFPGQAFERFARRLEHGDPFVGSGNPCPRQLVHPRDVAALARVGAAAYAKPAALDPDHGDDPIGYTLFAKVSLGH